MSVQKRTNKKRSNPKPTEHIQVATTDISRRQMLKLNISRGYGKAIQCGSDIQYTVGTESAGYIKYSIKNAKLSDCILNSVIEK